MIGHFSDRHLASNAKEAQKFKVPFGGERRAQRIVRDSQGDALMGIGTFTVLAPRWFRVLVDKAGKVFVRTIWVHNWIRIHFVQ
jgi:hypothetical protein